MSINTNHINVTLTAEQAAALTSLLDELDTATPFLVSLLPEERKSLFKLGSRSEGFAREALQAAILYPQHLPASIGLAELQRDVNLRDTLLPVLQRVRTLYTKMNDTWMLAGGDAMRSATRIYRVLQAHRGEGLDETLDVLAQRFERPSRTPATEPTPVPPAV